MDGKKNLIVGLVLATLLAGGLFFYKQHQTSPETPAAQTVAPTAGQQQAPAAPTDPYANFSAPAK